jgi:hypothetical protein
VQTPEDDVVQVPLVTDVELVAVPFTDSTYAPVLSGSAIE